MNEYHKIQSVFLRDLTKKAKPFIEGAWARPEFEYLVDNPWILTEKVDGTNIRVMFRDGGVSFGGKTDAANIPAKLVTRLNSIFLPLQDRMREMFPDGACLYGEGYGAKIQAAGANYRLDQDFVLFDVKIGEWWLQRVDVEDIAGKLGIDVVPVVGVVSLRDAVAEVRDGMRSRWGEFQSEGVVARPMVEFRTRNGGRIITKIKTRDFQK